MLLPEARRAVAAARFVASAHDLPVDEAVVLRNSNRLAVRLLPCDVLARVAPSAEQNAAFEVELAQRLADADSPVAALEPRVEPGVYERDGFAITLWTYYEELSHREVSPPDYANALARLHAGMRSLQLATPHFTDRLAEAEALVANPDRTPTLAEARYARSSTVGQPSRCCTASRTPAISSTLKVVFGSSTSRRAAGGLLSSTSRMSRQRSWSTTRTLTRC